MRIGKVYLVGAGPGDPDLITRKGLRLLRRADVVIYDRLIPPGLLEETRSDAELIYVGKQPTRHRLSQERINRLLVDRALNGKEVLRLKGGDPLVFGRGGEEALACRDYGIAFEIVPGVSSSYAVPAYAGIPLTQRHISSAFTVITGHESPDKSESAINYQALCATRRHNRDPDGREATAVHHAATHHQWAGWGYTRRRHRMGHAAAPTDLYRDGRGNR